MKTTRFTITMLFLALLACDQDQGSDPRAGETPCGTSSDTGSGSDTVAVTGTEDTAGALGCCYCDQWGATECVDGVFSEVDCKAYAAKSGAPTQWCEDWCVLECDQPAAWCCSCAIPPQCELTTAGEAACVAISGNVWCEPDPFGGITACTAQCG